jgi:hypothetical protein
VRIANGVERLHIPQGRELLVAPHLFRHRLLDLCAAAARTSDLIDGLDEIAR